MDRLSRVSRNRWPDTAIGFPKRMPPPPPKKKKAAAPMADAGPKPEPTVTPDDDPVAVIEAALIRLKDDVGVLAEESVVQAFSILKVSCGGVSCLCPQGPARRE